MKKNVEEEEEVERSRQESKSRHNTRAVESFSPFPPFPQGLGPSFSLDASYHPLIYSSIVPIPPHTSVMLPLHGTCSYTPPHTKLAYVVRICIHGYKTASKDFEKKKEREGSILTSQSPNPNFCPTPVIVLTFTPNPQKQSTPASTPAAPNPPLAQNAMQASTVKDLRSVK